MKLFLFDLFRVSSARIGRESEGTGKNVGERRMAIGGREKGKGRVENEKDENKKYRYSTPKRRCSSSVLHSFSFIVFVGLPFLSHCS